MFFIEVWVISNLLKSQGLFFVFWPILIMLSFEWSFLLLSYPHPPVPVPIIGDCMKHINYKWYHIIIIIIILLIWAFFTPVLADGFPLESVWKQVSSSIQDSPLYSSRYELHCSLDGLHSPSYFKIPPFPLQILW